MIEITRSGIKAFCFESLNAEILDHAVFSRQGGVSKAPYHSLNLGGTVGDDPVNVLENHKLIFGFINRPFESRFDVWQVHGNNIISADRPRKQGEDHIHADGIFTDKPGLTLLMRFADCVPILIFDPKRKVIGIIHAGWQGTLNKIGADAVNYAQDNFGCKSNDLIVGIGPSICPDCYQIGGNVAQMFVERFGENANKILINRSDGIFLDLWLANQITLIESGVKNIEQSHLCTAQNLGDFYSHRAEKGRTGRFGVLMGLKVNN